MICRKPLRRLVLACAASSSRVSTPPPHSWLWRGLDPGLSGVALVWIDLPVSLLYLDEIGPRLLTWSLALGGLWWGLVGAPAAWLIGRIVLTRS